MIEIKDQLERAYDMFESSFLYKEEELILHKKWNIYFRIVVDLWPEKGSRPVTSSEFDYKLLSYLSFYTADNHEKKNSLKCKWAWNRINRWFRRDFTYEELQVIYQKLGTGSNRPLGVTFIESNCDMDILKSEES